MKHLVARLLLSLGRLILLKPGRPLELGLVSEGLLPKVTSGSDGGEDGAARERKKKDGKSGRVSKRTPLRPFSAFLIPPTHTRRTPRHHRDIQVPTHFILWFTFLVIRLFFSLALLVTCLVKFSFLLCTPSSNSFLFSLTNLSSSSISSTSFG